MFVFKIKSKDFFFKVNKKIYLKSLKKTPLRKQTKNILNIVCVHSNKKNALQDIQFLGEVPLHLRPTLVR